MIWKFLVLLTLFPTYSLAQAQLSQSEMKDMEKAIQDEFEMRKRQLEKRYEDFYVHFNEKERRDYERRASSGAHREVRTKLAKDREKSRQEFVKNRKEKQVQDDSAHLRKLAAQKKRREQARTLYVRKRDRLRSLREGVKKIPEEKEVGID